MAETANIHRNASPARIGKEVEESLSGCRPTISTLSPALSDPVVPIEETAGAFCEAP